MGKAKIRMLIKVIVCSLYIFQPIQADPLPDDANVNQLGAREGLLSYLREKTNFENQTSKSTSAAEQDNFDVLHYQVNLDIDPVTQIIDGKVTINAKSTVDELSSIVIDLYDNMTVSSVKTQERNLNFTHSENRINIVLDENFNTDQEFQIDITYRGHPVEDMESFIFGSHIDQPIISSFSVPYFAGTWWPCKDIPSDKATAEMNVTVPEGLVVASNGILTDTIDSGNKLTYKWRETYPISTYLISISITNYSTFSDYYISASGDSTEVVYYVYPEHLGMAMIDFDVTVQMIEFFASVFGEYPFIDEKYGMAEFPFNSAMEHQTITSYASRFITGDHRYDWVVAHELAHQWWGDLVTLDDWYNMWLNEGFATYSQALWFEYINGEQAYKDHMNLIELYVSPSSIYDLENPFKGNTYFKGAWVLHMLRHIVGEQIFWNILPRYASKYAYANASTEDFQAVCESEYGKDLDWFFSQWIYSAGRPNYEYSWDSYKSGQNYIAYLHIEQAQAGLENSQVFTMPLDIAIKFSDESEMTFVVTDSSKVQDFRFSLDKIPTSLQIDRDDWVLKQLTEKSLDVPATAGDLNGDDNINIEDLIRLINIIIRVNASPSLGELAVSDVNGDNKINVTDLIAVIRIIIGR